MTRKFLFLCLAFGVALMTYAADLPDGSYLYWMTGSGLEDFQSFDSVKVAAIGDSETKYLNLFASDGTFYGDSLTINYTTLSGYADRKIGFYAALADGMGDSYSYVIELFKNETGIAESAPLSAAGDYLKIVNGGTITPGMLQMPTMVVPEPSSAFLILLGCAGLALRRRRLMHA